MDRAASDYDTEWYRSFFGSDYLHIYGGELTAERSEEEAGFVMRALGLRPGDRVLDLCCGPGRHSVPLAAAGLSVTGLDMSDEYLGLAEEAARKAGVSVRLVRGDMRELAFRGEFDAVVSMFTAFGYFESEDEDQRVLDGAAAALRPGGKLLLDLLSRDWVVANHVRSETRQAADGAAVREMREFDPVAGRSHVEFEMTDPDGQVRRAGHHIRLYVATEISRMLQQAGLVVERTYGGYDGSGLSVDARRMVLVARKLRRRVVGYNGKRGSGHGPGAAWMRRNKTRESWGPKASGKRRIVAKRKGRGAEAPGRV